MAGVGRLGWEGGFTVETGKTRSHEKGQNNMSCTSIQLHILLGLWHGTLTISMHSEHETILIKLAYQRIFSNNKKG